MFIINNLFSSFRGYFYTFYCQGLCRLNIKIVTLYFFLSNSIWIVRSFSFNNCLRCSISLRHSFNDISPTTLFPFPFTL
nr:MAG TPA: hypothetical protein [Bacteriophage sp.]